MQPNRLLNLFRANKDVGEKFRAEGNVLFVYDHIVSSKADADWLGGVDAETFNQTLSSMNGDVSVRINSPGGDVFAGIAMANAIAAYPGQVTCVVDSFAASAASIIAIAGDKIEMAKGARMMIHKAWTIAAGNADEFMKQAATLEGIDATLAESYADAAAKRGKDNNADMFSSLMAAETWLTGQQAIEAGLADEVSAIAPKAMKQWDLSAYAKPPVQDTSVTITIEIEDAPEAPEAPDDPAAPDMPDASALNEQRQRIAALRLRTPA
jgi:ATP-dependent Clp protease protease subunit